MQSRIQRRYRTVLVLIALLAGFSAPAQAQDLERGEELFQLCGTCHGAEGEGNELYLAPAIGGMPLWYLEGQLAKFRDGGRGHALRRPRRHAHAAHGDVAAHRARRRPEGRRRLRGGAARAEAGRRRCPAATPRAAPPTMRCARRATARPARVCRPPTARRSPTRATGTCSRRSSASRPACAARARATANGAVMRGMASILQDEQAMKDVIAHMTSLAGK